MQNTRVRVPLPALEEIMQAINYVFTPTHRILIRNAIVETQRIVEQPTPIDGFGVIVLNEVLTVRVNGIDMLTLRLNDTMADIPTMNGLTDLEIKRIIQRFYQGNPDSLMANLIFRVCRVVADEAQRLTSNYDFVDSMNTNFKINKLERELAILKGEVPPPELVYA